MFNFKCANGICRIILLTVTIFAQPHMTSDSVASEIDTRFLSEQPYRKTKQRVDVSGISNAADMLIFRSAVNDIMRFVYMITMISPKTEYLERNATKAGQGRLKLPPIRHGGVTRLVANKISYIKVVDNATIVLDIDYHWGGQPQYQSTFVFIKTESGWKFDRHLLTNCQVPDD